MNAPVANDYSGLVLSPKDGYKEVMGKFNEDFTRKLKTTADNDLPVINTMNTEFQQLIN